jgi:SOS-response transcriptional repressor LexA
MQCKTKIKKSKNVLPFPVKNFTPEPEQAFREIRKPVNHRPTDEYVQARLCDDSLKGDGFLRGDVAIIRKTNDLREITPGRIVAAMTPIGLLLKHAYIKGKKITLCNSAPSSNHLCFTLGEVEIFGVAIRMERDLSN